MMRTGSVFLPIEKGRDWIDDWMTTLTLLFLLIQCPFLISSSKVSHQFSFVNLQSSVRESDSRNGNPYPSSTDLSPPISSVVSTPLKSLSSSSSSRKKIGLGAGDSEYSVRVKDPKYSPFTDQSLPSSTLVSPISSVISTPLKSLSDRRKIAFRIKASVKEGSGEDFVSIDGGKIFNLANLRASLRGDGVVDGSGEYEYEYIYEDELEEWERKQKEKEEGDKKETKDLSKKGEEEEDEYEEVYEYVYEDEIETTPAPPFVFREAVIEMENEEASGFTDDFTLPEQKSKVVITEISHIDTRLFERELMSMRVRDEQVSHIRDLLHNASYLELDTGESHKDHGGSYVKPLLQAVNYDNNTVPLIFSDIPVHVRTQLKVLYLGNFDSHLMEFTVDAEMNMRWFDLRLVNNFTRPIRLREKSHIDLIWRPDPYFVNSKYSYFHHVTFPNFRMIITPQGLVSYTMRVTLLPSCPMIFCRYPHDRQECDLRMSSIAYPRSLVRFTWHSTPYIFQSRPDLPELTLADPWADECTVEGKLIASSCLRLVFNLRREEGRYIVEKYLPSALAMMFSWVAPYVPYHYEEVRIVTPITVLLTLVQMEKGDAQVRTSYLTSIDFWFAVMKIFTVMSLIESIIVLALIKQSRAVEKQCEKAANEYERMKLNGKRQTMRRLVTRVDRFSQLSSPLIFIAFLLYYVLILSRGDEKDCVNS